MTPNVSFPAEWYPQSGIQLTWPHPNTDWAYMLDEVTDCYKKLASEISQREKLIIVTPCPDEVKKQLQDTIDIESVRFIECLTNDTWARDHGGITVFRDGVPVIYDFKFNGWGLKFAANYDNLITSTLYNENVFNALYENKLNFVLEGGALESDGAGTLLTTSECLLSPNRNGEWTRSVIEEYLKRTFGLQRILWLAISPETTPIATSTHWPDLQTKIRSFTYNAPIRKTSTTKHCVKWKHNFKPSQRSAGNRIICFPYPCPKPFTMKTESVYRQLMPTFSS